MLLLVPSLTSFILADFLMYQPYCDITNYEAGKIYPELKAGNDVAKLDMDDSGLVLHIGFSKPTAKEKRNFNRREILQVRLVQMMGITFLLYRFGTLNWIDTPFNVNLAKRLTAIPDIPEGMGLLLTVLFFDSFSGEMISIRNVGLPTDFSRKLTEIMEEDRKRAFDMDEYNRQVLTIQNWYPASDLARNAICEASFTWSR